MFSDINSIDQIFYINLDHRDDREARLLQNFKTLGINPDKICRVAGYHTPLNGHIGCALSHIKALLLAREKKYRHVLILEDDITIQGTKEEVNTYLSHFNCLQDDWDVLMLGGEIEGYQKTKDPYILRVISGILTHSYIVNYHYLNSLIGCFKFSLDQIEAAPSYPHPAKTSLSIDQFWKKLQPHDKWYIGTYPLICQYEDVSDIMHTAKSPRGMWRVS